MPNGETTPSYLPRPLPPELAGLAELALDLRWNWNHSADRLWQAVAPDLWETTGNAWLILESVSYRRLRELAGDVGFRDELRTQLAIRAEYLNAETWYATRGLDLGSVAYFSMEFGLGEALPIYSGGLGILAGDVLKTASDLGVPLIGVGLLYHRGYFRQGLDSSGRQIAFYPYNDPTLLPILPLRDADGDWLRVEVELPGRTLHLRPWQVQVGRTCLYLLDSNHPLNSPRDRGITGELYGDNREIRLEQSLILGIGGWRLLEKLGVGCAICHLNEGHAAFAALERASAFMARTGADVETALRCSAAGNVFTTHTPVAAAFDRYPRELVAQYLADYAERIGLGLERLIALGRADPDDASEPFNMAYLAVRCANRVNGVSRLHGAVSRRLLQPLFPQRPAHEVPVGHVTNGVHMPSWDSAEADRLWTTACGKARWLGTLEAVEEQLRRVDDESLWMLRGRARQQLVARVRERAGRQQRARGGGPPALPLLDPNTLTVGFARRFATYKRPNLLLHDPARLTRLLRHPHRPVQLVVAGKAHPADEAGKAMVQAWTEFMHRPEVAGRVVFVEDYDMGLGAELVQGVDLWINTPRRPWEASGTSGMKVLVNGGLNLSVLDGWWAEAFLPEAGWALGDGAEHGPEQDPADAEALYRLLETEVVPEYYACDEQGIPRAWVRRIRESMARLTPAFSANRMLRDYVEGLYAGAAADCRERSADGGRLGAELAAWQAGLAAHWPQVHFGSCRVESTADHHRFTVQAYLGELDPEAVVMELYAEPEPADTRHLWPMTRHHPLAGAVNGFVYAGEVPAARPAGHYTPRLLPFHPKARVPQEATAVLWYDDNG